MTVKAQTQITHLTPSSPQIQPQPTTKLQSPLTHFIQLPKSSQLPHPHPIILPIEKFETLSNKYHSSYDTPYHPSSSILSDTYTLSKNLKLYASTITKDTTPYSHIHSPTTPYLHPSLTHLWHSSSLLPHTYTINSPITP